QRFAHSYLGKLPHEARLVDRHTIGAVLLSLASRASEYALSEYHDGVLQRRYSYGELLLEVARAAYALQQRLGVRSGDRVAAISGNCAELYILAIATMAIGAVIVPINPEDSAAQISYVLQHAQPTLIVGRTGAPIEGSGSAAMQTSLDSLFGGQAPAQLPTDEVHPDSPAVMVYTSGTTSRPKGVCLSHYNLLVNAEALRRCHDLGTQKTHMCVLPLF